MCFFPIILDARLQLQIYDERTDMAAVREPVQAYLRETATHLLQCPLMLYLVIYLRISNFVFNFWQTMALDYLPFMGILIVCSLEALFFLEQRFERTDAQPISECEIQNIR